MDGGAAQDITPAPDSGFNVRTRVHEYGGGELVLSCDAVYFSNFQAKGGRCCLIDDCPNTLSALNRD